MPTAIEDLLFPGATAHVVSALTLSASSITLAVAPWGEAGAAREFVFARARLTELASRVEADAEAFALPWLVVGCKCEELPGKRWRFLLSCGEVLLEFESEWPNLNGG